MDGPVSFFFKNKEVQWHCKHVQNLTMLFYENLPHEYQNVVNPVGLEYAAFLHDIGKLEISESILNKPGKLDDEEWKIMRTHPELGVKIIESLGLFDGITDWVLYHHERIDGKGYYKLKGPDIPLASRIIAITDTYSAITMKRPYEDAKTHEEAFRIIREVAGTQLDKELVDIFTSISKTVLEKCQPCT
ncbi:HD-GYP domain-containing protein [Butyrivibrio sp. INlla16]|uniref:HD-GYP domain-containing protein n=1 Tax=Butyrivibrio sp. INlla16 TaxID=1520807 RepID=UPI00088899DE|nr:HD domain-containing phosphohydrolase [Butyrivibrio sp. INlla16]SDB04117.1 HDIG domain-containing protein [Butyrivibrio sp. INlla16]